MGVGREKNIYFERPSLVCRGLKLNCANGSGQIKLDSELLCKSFPLGITAYIWREALVNGKKKKKKKGNLGKVKRNSQFCAFSRLGTASC